MQSAPYAMRDELTEGRRYPEPGHPYRTDYQRDRDRIIHSKAFRRLENKTQVFDPSYSDHFRNRLTHTLEVAQISRTVGRALGLNEDLCEVLALSHDIGHPPFSHEGERVLNEIMTRFGSGFDHNLHALRIVEDFEETYPSFRGLNLTFEVREGIIKHSRDYLTEDETYIDISSYRPGERPPLEAQLIDFCDEIAYNTADLSDGYDSGILSIQQLLADVPVFQGYYLAIARDFTSTAEKLMVSETVRRIINHLATSLILESQRRLTEAGVNTVDDVRRFPDRLCGFDPDARRHNQELKSFLHANLYNHPQLRAARRAAQDQLEELFDFYLKHADSLPQDHQVKVPGLELHRVVCDYVAGMTDQFARSRYSDTRGVLNSESRERVDVSKT